jgi:hypothetical protein
VEKEAADSWGFIGGVFEEGGEGRRGWRRARRAGAEAGAGRRALGSSSCHDLSGREREKSHTMSLF